MKKTAAFIFLLLLIAGTVWIVRFRGTSQLRTAQGGIFGTTYHVKYESPQPLDAEILAELQRVDASLSVFNPQSVISQINDGRRERVDAMLYEVLQKARQVSEATGGAFDITVMPLVNAWGFGFKHGKLPVPDREVDSLRALVGYRRLELTSDSVLHKEDARISIDCGAIAKGYGVDRVARLLRDRGVRNFMVEIGGEVVTKGRNPQTGNPWQIGVSRPDETRQGEGEVQTVLSLENAALATSGNYHNFYIRDGRKYAHTIDPRTGRPVQHSLLSATVMAHDCATADAYATAFMVMGLDSAMMVARRTKGLKAYFIYADGQGRLRTASHRLEAIYN
ncbi:FAD:protein FMN transferase [bacterium]|nr:FAD:protein FMN transferase [bacterium]